MPASGHLTAVAVREKEGEPSHIAHTGSYSRSPDGEPMGGGLGALPGPVVYLVPAVITVEISVREIAPGEALGVRGVRE
jgi:hypothetical protein